MASLAQERVEHLIVGGGVIGLSVAFELLCRGRSVLVLERGEPGCGATDVAAGMLAPVSEADTGPDAVVGLGQESLLRYPEFVQRVTKLVEATPSLRDYEFEESLGSKRS